MEKMETPEEIWATDLGQGYYEGTITKQYPNDTKYVRADIYEALKDKLKNHGVSHHVSESLPTPMQFVKEKYGLKKIGESYVLPKISIRKCVQFMNEYVKKYYSR